MKFITNSETRYASLITHTSRSFEQEEILPRNALFAIEIGISKQTELSEENT